jgi:DNA-binding Lrp family transcriptional regulator
VRESEICRLLRRIEEPALKDIDLRLVSELMKNSRRSDRDLAKTLRVSQPTVTRVRTRLEREGIIREYTVIPDYARLGFEIASMTFARLKEPMSQEATEEIRKTAREREKKNPAATILAMNGIGCDAERVVIAFHKNYSEFTEFLRFIKQYPPVKVDEIKSFIIDLSDKGHFRNLTFSVLADRLPTMKEDAPKKGETARSRRTMQFKK